MKKINKGRLQIGVVALTLVMMLAAFLPGAALFTGKSKEESAVSVFAKSQMPGDVVTFSAADFESRVTGKEKLTGIVINELPDAQTGVLRVAGRDVMRGEGVETAYLNTLTFAPATQEDIHTSFTFIPVFAKSGASQDAVTVAINLSEQPNRAPIALDLSYETYANLTLVGKLGAVDAESDQVSYSVVKPPKKGELEFMDSMFIYTPEEGASGADSFTYRAIDSFGNPSETAQIDIQIDKRPLRDALVYSDMELSPAHYAAIKLAEAGVFAGERIGADNFLSPDKPVTRAEFVALVAAIVDMPLPTMAVSTGLADNDAVPAWAQTYVAAAINCGIVQGEKTSDGNRIFRASDGVTRAEAAAIVNRALGLADDRREASFTDADSVPAWAEQSLVNVSAAGLLDTYADGSIRAGAQMTREEVVDMLYETMLKAREQTKSGGILGIFKK